MARIIGVNLPNPKRIEIGLTYIFGIGLARSQKILKEANINPDKRVKDLTGQEADTLKKIIERDYKVEGYLRREVTGNIKRLKDVGCYRGSRHAKHLPARGQRSKTNSRTVRGNVRRTAGSGRRDAGKKV